MKARLLIVQNYLQKEVKKTNKSFPERRERMEKKENSFTRMIGGVNFIINIKAAEDATQEAEEFIKDLIAKDVLAEENTEKNKEDWAIPIYSLFNQKN